MDVSAWLEFVLVLCLIACVMCVLKECGARLLGRLVKSAIESLDEEVLGVRVSIGHLTIHPFKGQVELNEAVVFNPPGYRSEQAVKVKKLFIDIDMKSVLQSRGNRMRVEVLQLLDVAIFVEVSSFFAGRSNVMEILDFVKETQEAMENLVHDSEGEDHEDDDAEAAVQLPSQPAHAEVQVDITAVQIKDIVASLEFAGLNNSGVKVAVADISYDDFTGGHGSVHVSGVIRILLKTVLKSVLHSVASKGLAQHISESAGRQCRSVC